MLLSEVMNLPEKQWCPDINPVVATLTVVGAFKQDQYGYKQPVQLKDDAGVSSEVTVQTKYEDGLMNEGMIGTKARWRCKWYGSQRGNKIVGYCLDKMQNAEHSTALPSQLSPPQVPQPQQAPPAAPQSPKAAPNVPMPRDYDAENRGKIRHGLVCAYISAGVDPDINNVNYWMEYIMTGKAPPPPGQAPPAWEGEQVPWEA